jgi:hypothetical protein
MIRDRRTASLQAFLPSFSKSSSFSSKFFQTFLWRFLGISRAYKSSRPICLSPNLCPVKGAICGRRGLGFLGYATGVNKHCNIDCVFQKEKSTEAAGAAATDSRVARRGPFFRRRLLEAPEFGEQVFGQRPAFRGRSRLPLAMEFVRHFVDLDFTQRVAKIAVHAVRTEGRQSPREA